MKSYLRFLGRNKLYTAIEVVGLSVSLAFVIPLINLLIDKYNSSHAHERYEDIYVVSYNGNLWTDVNFGDYLSDRIPDIERTSSAIVGQRTIIDKDFFYFFPFEFIEGNESFLDIRDNIAISDRYAATITDGSAIGKTIKIDGKEYNVAAVFKGARNDILKECDILQNIEPFKELHISGGQATGVTLVSLKTNHDRQEIENKILNIADEYAHGDEMYLKLKEAGVFRGIIRYDELPTAICNYSQFMKYGEGQMLFLHIIIFLIFIVAILNYINLNVAVSTKRAKENATRKLVGATRRWLIVRNLTESFAFTAFCFILGYLLSGYTGSFIKGLLAMIGFSDFSVDPSWNIISLASFISLIIVTSLIAGISPSLISSRFSPLDVTKGDFRLHSKRRLSRFFISFQTVLSIILISVVLMMNVCYKEAMKVDFNCDIEDVAYIRTSPEIAEILVSKASVSPEVISVGVASQVPGEGFSGQISMPDGQQHLFSNIECDRNGFRTFGFEIMEQYDDEIRGLWLTPLTRSFVERDSLLLNSILSITGTDRVAGIINDFPGTPPLAHRGTTLTFASVKDYVSRPGVVIRTDSDHEKSRGIIMDIYREALENKLMLEDLEEKKQLYVTEIMEEGLSPIKFIVDLIGIVMGIVVIMTMMGLIGMSIHFTNERRNEIAIRKIFGSSENGELVRNLKFYLIITSIALIPAISIAELLRAAIAEYGIRPDNVWWTYIVAVVLSFAFSLSSVLWQTLRAARTNPAEALKKE